jgi:methyl-accepting chemotaxis protein
MANPQQTQRNGMREKLEFKILSAISVVIAITIVVAAALVLHVERSDIHSLGRERLEATAQVVASALEHTMLDADDSVTRHLIDDLHQLESFKAIQVFDANGSDAFRDDSPVVEAEALRKLGTSETSFSVDEDEALTFYFPLINKPECQGCHDPGNRLQGAVKIAMSLENENRKASQFIFFVTVGSLLIILLMILLLRKVIRRFVIEPINTFKVQVEKLAHGNLSFEVDIAAEDEIGKLGRSIRESLSSLSEILHRVKDFAERIANVSGVVQTDSDKVVHGTGVEAVAVADISNSVEQLDSVITDISDSTETLAVSATQSAVSVREMATSIGSITETAQQLAAGIDGAAASIGEISGAIGSIASNADELASVSDKTLSVVDEMMTSIDEVGQSAKDSLRLSEKVAEDASTLGATAIDKTIRGMQEIQATVERTSLAVDQFASRSEQIGSITTVIEGITDQATFLAFNAEILAAQAGEHGRGFSVVAGEIRGLVERTDSSTQEIAKLVDAVRQEINEAVEAMAEGLRSLEEGLTLSQEASHALDMIQDSANQSTEMASSIEKATAEHSKTAVCVAEAMKSIGEMIRQISSAASGQSRAVALLGDTSQSIQEGAHQVGAVSQEQATGSTQISQSVDVVSERTQEISTSISEQRIEAKKISSSLKKIQDIPGENRDIAIRINNVLQELLRDSELLCVEMRRFALPARPGSVAAPRASPARSSEEPEQEGPLSRPAGRIPH